MKARATNLLVWAGIVTGADILIGAAFAWIRYLAGPSLRLGAGLPDFFIYSALGRQLQARGLNGLYDLTVQRHFQQQVTGGHTTVLPYISPPYVAPIFYPLGWLDLKAGYIVWSAISIALIAASIVIVVRGGSLRGRGAWAVGLLAASWLPALVTVLQGQTTGIVLIGLALVAAAWQAGREIHAGSASVLALARPHMSLALPVLFALRSRRALLALAAMIGLVLVVTFPFVGADNWHTYLQLVVPWLVHGKTLPGVEPEQAPYSLRGLLEATGADPVLVVVPLAAVTALVIVLLLRGRPSPRLDFALAVTASVVLSPHQNLHDLVLLVVPLVILATGEKRSAVFAWAAMAACYLGVELALFNPLGAQIGMLALLAYLCGERLWPRRQLAI